MKRNNRRRATYQHVAYIRGSPVFSTVGRASKEESPPEEESLPEERRENLPQEDVEWEELEAMSRDEEEFMRKTVPYIRQRDDGMIEIPLPFKEPDPMFVTNR